MSREPSDSPHDHRPARAGKRRRQHVDDHAWVDIEAFTRPLVFGAGSWLARAEHPLLGIHRITSGLVGLADQSQDHLARSLVLEAGDTFGEYSVVAGARVFPSALRALTKVETQFLPAELYRRAASRAAGFEAHVRARATLLELLPAIVEALRRHPALRTTAVAHVIRLALLGDALVFERASGLRERFRRGDLVFVGRGELRVGTTARLLAGSLIHLDDELRRYSAGDASCLIRFNREVFRTVATNRRHSYEEGSQPDVPKQVVMVASNRPGTPLSSLSLLLAQTLQLESPPRNGDRPVGLLRVQPRGEHSALTPEQLAQARAVGVDLVTTARLGETRSALARMRADCVLLDASACPADEVERELGALVSKLVFITQGAFDSPPSAFRRCPVVRCVVLPQSPIGESLAYHPGTVRLAFDNLRTLETRPLTGLSARDRASLSRCGRAICNRRVGVALGGGGALGYAHVALLRELCRVGMPIDFISGVSIGSLTAAFFALGGGDYLQRLVDNARQLQLVLLASTTVPSLVETYLNAEFEHRRLEQLEVPLFPVGMDLQTGEEWTPTRGTVAHGVRGSSMIAGMFSPLVTDGARVIDGAYVNNVPEGILSREGADFIIASNVVQATVPQRISRWEQLLSVIPTSRMNDSVRTLSFLATVADDRDKALANLTFRPPRSSASILDFGKAEAIVAAATPEAAAFAYRAREVWMGNQWRVE